MGYLGCLLKHMGTVDFFNILRNTGRKSIIKGSDSQVRALEISFKLTLLLLFGKIGTFIVQLLTAAEAYLHLYKRFSEVNSEGNQSVALLLELSHQLVYLILMHEKLSVTESILVEDIALLIGIYMHSENIDLAVSDAAVGLFDGALAHTKGLDLSAGKFDAALKGFVHKIIVICFFIVGNKLCAFFFSVISHIYLV